MNAKICKETVSMYKIEWEKRDKVYKRVLNEWEKTVHSCIDSRIQSLRKKYVNEGKKHILKGKYHLEYLP